MQAIPKKIYKPTKKGTAEIQRNLNKMLIIVKKC